MSAPMNDDAVVQVTETASADGSWVFFRSAEQLTDTSGSGLFMWECEPRKERQTLVVDASGGSFTLTAHTQPSSGSGTFTNGSTEVTGMTNSFRVDQTISGGWLSGSTVVEVGTFESDADRTITLSAPATRDGEHDLTASIAETTDPLPWNATAAQVQSALESLSVLGIGTVVVSGGPGGSAPYAIELIGAFAGANVMELTADATRRGPINRFVVWNVGCVKRSRSVQRHARAVQRRADR